jgi:hypothetical protein
MRALACVVAVVAGGCTMEVGEGQIPPIYVDYRMNLPSYAARSGKTEASWTDGFDEQLGVHSTDGKLFLSVLKDIEFFTAGETSWFQDLYGSKIHAVVRVDIKVKELTLTDPRTSDPITQEAELAVDGVTVGPTGFQGRVTLSGDTRDKLVDAIDAAASISFGVGVNLSCAPADLPEVPNGVKIHVVVQPVLVVDELKLL